MLMKILVVMVLVGLALLALRSALGKKKSDETADQDRGPAGRTRRGRGQGATRLLACEACGAMTPEGDVVWREGKPYCSEDHAGL